MSEKQQTRSEPESCRLLKHFVNRAKEQLRLHGHGLNSTSVDDIRWGEMGIREITICREMVMRRTSPEDRELMKQALEIAVREIRQDI